ncbi:MAG: hypothetical protein KAH95_16155 [Spirochaetales bacterium]|nr:hypothetical protein [Spirochaetales bacterium]
MKTITSILILVLLIVFNLPAEESVEFDPDLNYAQVEFVKAVQSSNGSWTFYVTVRHNDEGWNHYANLWEVVDPKSGEVFAERILAHPHETEQPFVRSQSRIVFPEDQRFVEVRAKCQLHGFEGKTVLIDLETEKGEDYKVILK